MVVAKMDNNNTDNRIVFALSGFSGSGKTTLIEKLIPIFRGRGYHVAVIKHDAHDFEIDKEGKDTEMLADCAGADIVLIEGYRDSDIKKLGVASSDTGYELPGPADDFEAIVTDDPSHFDKVTDKPVFDRNDVRSIADWMLPAFTHFDDEGNARMVTVADKDVTHRSATAGARVLVNPHTFELIKQGRIKKGDVLTVAQVAGIMGAKRTPDLIPMCHPVIIDGADVKLFLNEKDNAVEIKATVTCTGRTGVEMEAITACSVAAMTVYDMCKAVQRDIVLTDICLLSKSGGVHGDYIRPDKEPISAGVSISNIL
ncbi:MAG: cyclic pyranopterin monophosphate synthase MoaC [Lachnospiraceae bacterium]|nr:cyclic pyranopterin monophosphate synthase MoaC [Lachnospiraceae bacterium]